MPNSGEISSLYQVIVFRYGLVLGGIYLLIRLIHNLIISASPSVLSLNILAIVVVSILFKIHKKYFQLVSIIFFSFSLVLIAALWNNYGGWNGGAAYTVMILLLFIAITTEGWIMASLILAYALAVGYLDQLAFINPNPNYSIYSLSWDFLVNVIILIFIALYLKSRFIRNNERVKFTNKRLEKSQTNLRIQSELLQKQKIQIQKQKNDRKRLLEGKKIQVREASDELAHYAFMNSHIVRSPLAKILGVIDLINIHHSDDPEMEKLQSIKSKAVAMDNILRKLAVIASQSQKSL